MRGRRRIWEDLLLDQLERLREPHHWYPYPVLISFGLCLLLTSQVVSGLNPRLGNPSEVLIFPGEGQPDSPLWFSVSNAADDMVITTGDRRVFRWPRADPSVAKASPLLDYLRQRIRQETLSAALAGEVTQSQLTAVLAVDRRVLYRDLRPIIYALAQANISRYSFETLVPLHTTKGG